MLADMILCLEHRIVIEKPIEKETLTMKQMVYGYVRVSTKEQCEDR